jgi:hypothetical protein
MMGSYTKLYKGQLDLQNYNTDLHNNQNFKGLNFE